MMSDWSLPPGVSLLPSEQPEQPDHLACPHCSARLPEQPTRKAHYETWEQIPAGTEGRQRTRINCGHLEALTDSGTIFYWRCETCGTESDHEQVRPIYADDIAENFTLLHIPEINQRYDTWAAWEEAAAPNEPMGLPNNVAEVAKREGIREQPWYWCDRTRHPEYTATTWTNGYGDSLTAEYLPDSIRLLLNGQRISAYDIDLNILELPRGVEPEQVEPMKPRAAEALQLCRSTVPQLSWRAIVNPLTQAVKLRGTSHHLPEGFRLDAAIASDGRTAIRAVIDSFRSYGEMILCCIDAISIGRGLVHLKSLIQSDQELALLQGGTAALPPHFSEDFMNSRAQPPLEERESFD